MNQREQFEEWAKERRLDLTRHRVATDLYQYLPTIEAWEIWQAAQLAAPASLPNCAQCNGKGQVAHRGGYTACYTCGGSGVGDAQLAAPGAPEPKKADFYCFPAGTYAIDKPAPGKRQPDDVKDAARYRWIRANSYIELTCTSPKVHGWNESMLDERVDAAMNRA